METVCLYLRYFYLLPRDVIGRQRSVVLHTRGRARRARRAINKRGENDRSQVPSRVFYTSIFTYNSTQWPKFKSMR